MIRMISFMLLKQALEQTFVFASSVMYYNYAGGVIAMNHENIFRVNGYSNVYWGWGNEDDDFSARFVDIMQKAKLAKTSNNGTLIYMLIM